MLDAVVTDTTTFFKADFERRLQDGFQLEDLVGTVGDTVRFLQKRLVEAALDAIPGDDGTAKANAATDGFMAFFDSLIDKAQLAVATAFGTWAGLSFEVVKGYYHTNGRAWLRQWVYTFVESGIKAMYNVLAADPESRVTSSRLEAALAHA
jgi:hypothetical protein